MSLLTNIFNCDIIKKNKDKVKKHIKFIEKVLFVLLLIATSMTGIKAQEPKISPSTLQIRDGTNGNEYSLEDLIDILSSPDKIGGTTKKGYVYYVTNGGIRLWEPPSSFRKHFWKNLNSVAKCQNWTLNGNEFIPENEMNNLSWKELITDYCLIDYNPWKQDEIKVFGWSHNKDQTNSKIVPSLRASHPNEGKLCFNTASFKKVNAPSELIPLRSTRCTNPLEKKFECQKKQKVSQVQNQTPMVVYIPTNSSTTTTLQNQFVYTPSSSGARAITVWDPSGPTQQQTAQVNNSSRFINLGLSIASTAASIVTQTQPQYYPQPPQYYPPQPIPQPIWGNVNPTLWNGYVDNGEPVQGNGAQPTFGGPAQGNGTVPSNGGPFQGNSSLNTGGGSSQGNGTTGGSVSGNGGVSTGGPVSGNGGNPSLGNGPRLFN